MVKQNPKEKLNNKAAKMIDLALDEVFTGGKKSITASFKDSRDSHKIYTLTVEVEVGFDDAPVDTSNSANTIPVNPSTSNDTVEPVPFIADIVDDDI